MITTRYTMRVVYSPKWRISLQSVALGRAINKFLGIKPKDLMEHSNIQLKTTTTRKSRNNEKGKQQPLVHYPFINKYS